MQFYKTSESLGQPAKLETTTQTHQMRKIVKTMKINRKRIVFLAYWSESDEFSVLHAWGLNTQNKKKTKT